MDRILDYLEQQLARPTGNSILACLAAAVLALGVSFILRRRLAAMDAGDERMQRIAEPVGSAVAALLRTRTTVVAVVAALAAVATFVFADGGGAGDGGRALGTAACVLVGAAGAAVAGHLGAGSATTAHVRTAQAAATGGLGRALSAAFGSGAATAFVVVGIAVFAMSALVLWNGDPILAFGLSLGASSAALFARCGSGPAPRAAFAAVTGPELPAPDRTEPAGWDDARNPAVLAEHAACLAGVNAGLFEAYVAAGVAAIALGLSAFAGASGAAREMIDKLPLGDSSLAVATLAFCAAGIVASLGGFFVVKTEDERKVTSALLRGIVVATLIFAVGAMVLTSVYDLNKKEVTRVLTGWVEGGEHAGVFAYGGPYGILIAVGAGLFAGVAAGKLTDMYTSQDRHHARRVADRSRDAAANVLAGLSAGMLSTALPTIAVVAAVGVSFWAAGAFGTAVAAVGALSTLGIWLAVDAYGPVARTANGVATMVRLPAGARRVTESLDSAGSATGAIARGFACASAALTALALLAVLRDEFRQIHPAHAELRIDVGDPRVAMGLFVGAMLPFLFSSFALAARGRADTPAADEPARGGEDDAAARAATKRAAPRAVRDMVLPGLVAVAAPFLAGFSPLGVEGLCGMLAGATVTGVLVAMFMSNAGGAWDNARKYVEAGVHGGKGSPAHKAAVAGDTVGDPFRDTAGPGLGILVKLMTLVSIVFLPLFL